MDTPQHVVALSGGKDSVALALRLKELCPDRDWQFVYTPTHDELPPMQAHWQRLHELLGPIRALNTISLVQLIYKKRMIPNFRARFCTRILKIDPFFSYMEGLPAGSVMYVGIRADEKDRLGLVTDKDDTFTVVKPFIDWGWGLKDVLNYLQCRGVEIPERTDCGACFYQRIDQWKALLDQYPERYESYVRIEEDIGHTFRSDKRDTWPASLKDLRREFESGRKIRNQRKQKAGLAACLWCSK